MLIRISHPLEQGLPLYPGTPSLSIIPYRTFEKGDASSSSTITFHTHSGTHIDAPRHFCPGGSTIADLLRAESIFTHVTILPLPMAGDTCIAARDLEPFLPQIQEGQAILIRTGDCLRRERDPGGYGAVHPWIHPGIADFLREHAPSLRLFGLDAISISSPAHREEGRECHRAFLCGSPPILLMEDIDLSDERLTGSGWSLHIYPWLLESLDGIPVTAIAERPEGEDVPVT